jgi:hypothetical protein
MATLPRPSLIHVAKETAIPLPERVTIAFAEMAETAREGLLALSVGVGLAVVGEIFEEEVAQGVGPRGKHNPERQAYRHGQEPRQLTLGGRRVDVPSCGREARPVRRSSWRAIACSPGAICSTKLPCSGC